MIRYRIDDTHIEFIEFFVKKRALGAHKAVITKIELNDIVNAINIAIWNNNFQTDFIGSVNYLDDISHTSTVLVGDYKTHELFMSEDYKDLPLHDHVFLFKEVLDRKMPDFINRFAQDTDAYEYFDTYGSFDDAYEHGITDITNQWNKSPKELCGAIKTFFEETYDVDDEEYMYHAPFIRLISAYTSIYDLCAPADVSITAGSLVLEKDALDELDNAIDVYLPITPELFAKLPKCLKQRPNEEYSVNFYAIYDIFNDDDISLYGNVYYDIGYATDDFIELPLSDKEKEILKDFIKNAPDFQYFYEQISENLAELFDEFPNNPKVTSTFEKYAKMQSKTNKKPDANNHKTTDNLEL